MVLESVAMDGIVQGADGLRRCWWCGHDEDYQRYHDMEWGRPERDERALFEKLSLESFQSGLSWLTILRKREGFREAFAGFDIQRVARFDDGDVERLLQDARIVRHRKKIEATINNACRALEMKAEGKSLSHYFWSFAEPESSLLRSRKNMVSTTPAAERLSKDLKKRGWRFVGPTTVYSFMQASGMVNDHLQGCSFREGG